MAVKNEGFPDLERYLEERGRHLVTYTEGATMYHIPYYSFVRLAKEAGANLPLRRTTVIDVDIIEEYRIDNRINSKLDQIAALNDLATRATSNISDMPGSPNRNIHKLEDAIVRIVDLQNEIGSDVNSLLEIKSQIVESIKQVTDPEGQVVLEERYLCYAKWEDIASELGYTVRQIFRVHDAALKEIVVPESCQ